MPGGGGVFGSDRINFVNFMVCSFILNSQQWQDNSMVIASQAQGTLLLLLD